MLCVLELLYVLLAWRCGGGPKSAAGGRHDPSDHDHHAGLSAIVCYCNSAMLSRPQTL